MTSTSSSSVVPSVKSINKLKYMSNNSSGGGVGIGTVIFIVLLILKLAGVISISWWWVFSPILISVGLWIIGLIIIGIFIDKNY